MSTFADLGLAESILSALTDEGYTTPTPIQAKSIPHILEGRDLLGCAQTGTGKTAAFSLPLIQRIMIDKIGQEAVEAVATTPEADGNDHRSAPGAFGKHPQNRDSNRGRNDRNRRDFRDSGPRRHIRALILSPTRELATQIGQSIRTYGKNTNIRYSVIFGGVGQGPQVDSLRSGIDVLVATPGRLLDLMNQNHVDLSHVAFFVLDEADRMLDMGFVHDIRRVIDELPPKRQNLMFSATMPTEIRKLANSFLHHPAVVEIAPVASTAELIEQFVYHVKRDQKPQVLAHIYNTSAVSRMLVFTRTKHGADRLVRRLDGADISSVAIHGNKTQGARQRALKDFKAGKFPVLVATDVAARGIDIDDISHVINYDVPNEPETYVHRIGRTGRAGAKGIAIALCDREEEPRFLRNIESLMKKKIEVKDDLPELKPLAALERDDRDDRDDRGDRRAHFNQSSNPRGSNQNGRGDFAPRRHSKPARTEHAPRAEHAPRSEHAHAPRGENRSDVRGETRVESRVPHTNTKPPQNKMSGVFAPPRPSTGSSTGTPKVHVPKTAGRPKAPFGKSHAPRGEFSRGGNRPAHPAGNRPAARFGKGAKKPHRKG